MGGRVFGGVRLKLLACVSAIALLPVHASAEPDGRMILAQAGMMSNQPRTERPAPPAAAPPAGASGFSNRPAAPAPAPGAAPVIVAPRPPANIVQPPAAAAPPAAPATAQPFSLTQNALGYTATSLRLAIGPTSYAIPTAEIRGSSLSRDELARILDPQSGLAIADRIRALSAAEIVIPELRAETQGSAGRHSATYRNIRLAGIAGGRIATAGTGEGTFEDTGPEGPSRGTFARMDMGEVDLGAMLSLLEAPPAGAAAELRRIYGEFSVEGVVTEGPKSARSRFARISGRDFRAKPTRDGWIATAEAFAGTTDLNKSSPEERSRAIGAIVDLFEAFELGSLEATGFEFSDAGGKDAAGRIGRMAYSSGPGGSEFRLEAFEAGGEEGRLRLASFSMGGISIAPVLNAARDLAPKVKPSAADLRRLSPVIGSVRLSGIEVEGKRDRESSREPFRVSLGSVELLSDKIVEGVPTDMRLAVRNVSVPIAKPPKDAATGQLLALGYDRVDASLTANLGWNEPGQELVVREISAEGTGMGSVLLRGVIGNVGRDAFSADPTLAAVTWMGATARSLDIVIQNAGLVERLLSRQAADKNRSLDDLRREYGVTAAVGIPVMLGNSPAAKAIGQAVARFIAKPGRLAIEAKARDGAGLGIADLAGAGDPTRLLDKVEISATAE